MTRGDRRRRGRRSGGAPAPTAGTGVPRRGATARAAAKAHEAAAALGAFDPVEPADRGSDGFPELGRDQVYAFRTGTVYHPIPCETVMHQWDQSPASVKVIKQATIGARRLCGVCAQTAV